MRYFVYIIYSGSTDTYYRGQTKDIEERLHRHNNGYEKSTQNGIPWTLVLCLEKQTRSEATILERKLKNLSRERLEDFIIRHSSKK